MVWPTLGSRTAKELNTPVRCEGRPIAGQVAENEVESPSTQLWKSVSVIRRVDHNRCRQLELSFRVGELATGARATWHVRDSGVATQLA